MRRTLPADFGEGAGALDPAAIAQVAAEAWPPMRDPDELHEALCSVGLLPTAGGEAAAFFEQLAAANRAATLTTAGRDYWVAAERVDLVRRAYPGAIVHPAISAPPIVRGIPESPEACAA